MTPEGWEGNGAKRGEQRGRGQSAALGSKVGLASLPQGPLRRAACPMAEPGSGQESGACGQRRLGSLPSPDFCSFGGAGAGASLRGPSQLLLQMHQASFALPMPPLVKREKADSSARNVRLPWCACRAEDRSLGAVRRRLATRPTAPGVASHDTPVAVVSRMRAEVYMHASCSRTLRTPLSSRC